jgi:hypothetical protein
VAGCGRNRQRDGSHERGAPPSPAGTPEPETGHRRGLDVLAPAPPGGPLAADLPWDGLLGRLASAAPGQRVWERVAEALSWEAWAIAWPVGAVLEPHDHGGSSGALTIALGELVETTVRAGEAGEIRTTTTVLERGSSRSFGAHHIHAVANVAPAPAISVHVYSPRLASMTHFDVVGGRLSPQRTVRYRAHR